ncbi:MAG: class II aldolase/adducin family protein [Pseudomonadota bacterium]
MALIDDGVIKFECDLDLGPAPVDDATLRDLDRWRSRLFDHGLIGEYAAAAVGFGNVSARLANGEVLVTGTQTGRLPRLAPEHYTRVVSCDLQRNFVHARGPTEPSSETLAHMALYHAIAECRAVFHVHDEIAWRAYRDVWPTTHASVPYGTPAMAAELARLYRESAFAEQRIAVMGGHEDGIIAWGRTLDEAGDTLVQRLRERH